MTTEKGIQKPEQQEFTDKELDKMLGKIQKNAPEMIITIGFMHRNDNSCSLGQLQSMLKEHSISGGRMTELYEFAYDNKLVKLNDSSLHLTEFAKQVFGRLYKTIIR